MGSTEHPAWSLQSAPLSLPLALAGFCCLQLKVLIKARAWVRYLVNSYTSIECISDFSPQTSNQIALVISAVFSIRWSETKTSIRRPHSCLIMQLTMVALKPTCMQTSTCTYMHITSTSHSNTWCIWPLSRAHYSKKAENNEKKIHSQAPGWHLCDNTLAVFYSKQDSQPLSHIP